MGREHARVARRRMGKTEPPTTCPMVPRDLFRVTGDTTAARLAWGADRAMLRALRFVGPRSPSRPPALLLLPARGRKTRHDPPAKSKIGRVKPLPTVDPAEFFVLVERYREYRQTVRALRLEFVAEVRKKVHDARAGILAERKALEDASEHRELMAWNQAENQRLHELRIARLLQEAREQEQRRAEEKACRAREAQACMQRMEQEVLQLQEEAKHFITRENLDARIEEALDSPKSYNWALTREGLVVKPQHRGS